MVGLGVMERCGKCACGFEMRWCELRYVKSESKGACEGEREKKKKATATKTITMPVCACRSVQVNSYMLDVGEVKATFLSDSSLAKKLIIKSQNTPSYIQDSLFFPSSPLRLARTLRLCRTRVCGRPH